MCLSSGEHVFSLVVVPKKVGAKMRRVVVGGNSDGVGGEAGHRLEGGGVGGGGAQ